MSTFPDYGRGFAELTFESLARAVQCTNEGLGGQVDWNEPLVSRPDSQPDHSHDSECATLRGRL